MSKIEMECVFSHEDTTVDLPERGLVLVTGRNGSGKTTLIEAVALCLWGTTFRKRNPGWSGDKGRVVVRLDDHKIERVKTKSKVKTTFDDKTSFTRVRDALEHTTKMFGSFDIWRRINVFSSRDVARFTTATDAFRKRMLEELLGLDRFEVASTACREDKKCVIREYTAATYGLDQAQSELQTAEARLKDAEISLDEEEPENVEALEDSYSTVEGKIARTAVALRSINRARKEADKAVWEADQAIAHAEKHERLLEGGTCSSCGQKITEKMTRSARVGVAKARATATGARKVAKEHREATEEQYENLKATKHKLTQKHYGLHSRVESAKAATRRQENREERRKKIAEDVIDFTDTVAECEQDEEKTRKELETLEVVDRVLSTQGVRAHLLANALSAIEAVANSWLGRVAAIDETELVLKLSSYAERGDGSLKDAIGLEIEGAGNGHGYEAASSGEQRRIDVALMLALAEMAEAAHGVESGTLFFDEVFDALDEEGVEAVRDVIASLAEDRCVLLITHNDQIKTQLKGLLTEHWHVEDGEIIYA